MSNMFTISEIGIMYLSFVAVAIVEAALYISPKSTKKTLDKPNVVFILTASMMCEWIHCHICSRPRIYL